MNVTPSSDTERLHNSQKIEVRRSEAGSPEAVRVHDVVDPKLGRASPYGIYDIADDKGWVSVGIDHHTAAFAVKAIRTWWANNAPCRTHIGIKRCEEIEKAKVRLLRKYGTNPTPDQLVASLMFGIWAALTHPKHCRVWPLRRAQVFPALPAPQSIRYVSTTADDVQAFRSRIFHHESLIRHNLSGEYGQICKLIGWICPETV